ncbi:MAG: hypothetical protein ABJC09_14365 [Terriglobia bacterium]
MALPAAAARKIDSVVSGVQFGLQSYIFTGIGLPQDSLVDVVIASMVECGLGECDLYAPLVEPGPLWDRVRAAGANAAERAQARAELTAWRASVSLDHYRPLRRRFEDAGIEIYAMTGFPGSTEAQLTKTFEIAEILGVRLISLAMTLSAAQRMAPMVEKSHFVVSVQGGPNMNSTNPDAVAKPEDHDKVLAFSKSYRLTYDIGDGTGGGFDSLQFVEQHHDRLAKLDVKDKRKDRVSMPYGEGDTPVAEILRLIRDRKYDIRCYLDCDHKTADRPADVKRSFEYVKAALR